MKYLLTILLLAGIVSADEFTLPEPPTTYPELAQYNFDLAEDILRNCEPNSVEYDIAKDTQRRCRDYLAHWRSDISRDGVINLIDYAMLCDAWLYDARLSDEY